MDNEAEKMNALFTALNDKFNLFKLKQCDFKTFQIAWENAETHYLGLKNKTPFYEMPQLVEVYCEYWKMNEEVPEEVIKQKIQAVKSAI